MAICTVHGTWQEEMVQFGPFPLDYGIENNLQPCPLIYLISLATFYFKKE